MSKLPVVAVVGRPNVGKSTLVNRFVGRRDAIVEEKSGVTRDRKEFETDWNGHSFLVVDTGGWLSPTFGDGAAPLAQQVSRQAERALVDADVVLMVVDVTVGVTDEDARVAHVLQRAGHAGRAGGQQVRRRSSRGRHLAVRPARARRSDRGVGHPRPRQRRSARPDHLSVSSRVVARRGRR